MSECSLERSEELICHKYFDVWRMNLGPDDYVDLAPLELELTTDSFNLPKPYMRRYTAEEIEWWKLHMGAMLKAGLFQRTSSGQLSPSNLVPKSDDGVRKDKQYRMVVDLRELNKMIKDLDFPIPKLDEVVHVVRGAKCFAKGDGTKGYRQFLLDKESRKYTGFTCPLGAFEHLRVPMGLKTAAAYYQRCMLTVLGDQLYNGVVQYIDDTLVYGSDEDELLDQLDKFFASLCRHNVKLHPAKFTLFAKKLTWGGKEVSGDGVKPSEKRLKAISEIPEPTTLAELMTFVYGVAWFRGHLPYFAEAAAPLYDLWKETMQPYKKKTTNKAKKFQLKDLPKWDANGKKAFREIKKMMADAVVNTYFDPKQQLCVFSDASDDFYCMVFTQCTPGDERLPWNEQVGKHSLLLVVSGRFRDAQLR